MPLDVVIDRIEPEFNGYVDELKDFLRIPSISTMSEHRPDIDRAAQWLADNMRSSGLENIEIIPTRGNPVVYGDWLHAGPDKMTLLIYGHYDVQPAGNHDEWKFPPFAAKTDIGFVYARGASDNKGQHFAHIKAIATLLKAEGKLPINVKLCIDGEEEVGSPNLPPFVEAEKERLAADLLVISDGAMFAPNHPVVSYALRGFAAVDVIIKSHERDLHSGSFGGTIYNPLKAMSDFLSSLHDDDGVVDFPGFYDDVRHLPPEERIMLRSIPYPFELWQNQTKARFTWGEAGYSLIERLTTRPTCEINGITGGYGGEGIRTIIPPEARAKISFRLVPDQDPIEIVRHLRRHAYEFFGQDTKIDIIQLAGAKAAVTPYDSPAVYAARRALTPVWPRKPIVKRSGGSLPIVSTFQDVLGVEFVLIPFGLDDNRHGINERYSLQYFRKGIETAMRFYYELSVPEPPPTES